MDASKVSIKELETELWRRSHEDPLALVYKPHEKQREFHSSRAFLTLLLGGNRTGKTFASVAEALYYCLGRTVFSEVPDPPVVVWYVMPSLTMARRSVFPVFEKLVPRKYIKRWSRRDGVVKFTNGSELHFVSADMKQMRLQGASVDLVIMDETPDEKVFTELQARVLDRHGRIILAFSPIDATTFWVRDKLFVPWQNKERPDIDVILMPVSDRDGNSLVPQFTKEDIKRMEEQWPDPAVRAARMYGEFITRTGMVFKQFDPTIHIIRPFAVPDEFARWMICDPEYHRFAVLYFAADEHGNYFVTDEYFSQDENLARRSEKLAFMIGRRDRAIPMYVDSSNPQDSAELNWHFSRLGVPVGATLLPMTKNVNEFVLRTQSMLEPSDERLFPKATGMGDCSGAPRLMFFSSLLSKWTWQQRTMSCSRLVWELQRLAWGKHGKPDKDSADGSDAVDCLIYGCSIYQTGYTTPQEEMWKKNLPPADILIWDAIDRMDRQRSLPFGDY